MLITIRRKRIRQLVLPLIAALFSLGVGSAQAGIISPGQAITADVQIAHLNTVNNFFAREDVRQNLVTLGVDPAQAAERAARMSPAELADLADHIEQEPAGGSIAGALGVLLIVLIVLEVLGVTDVFKAI